MQLQSEDRISDLPDEILVSILSLLHTKQAVGTSVLAPRWRDLWTFTHHLKFVDCSIDGFLDDNYKAFQVKRTRFVNGVNQVLRLHKGTVTEFILHFRTYARKFTSDVDSWINFALHNKVKRLNLEYISLRSTWGSRYYLNTQILQNYCLDSLTTLCLCSMVVTGKVLEYFLSACPLLESLSVSTSSVGDLKVSGPDLKLKHLELLHCDLLSVEISAVNLVSFTYQGPKTRISFKDTPRLIKASFGAPYARSIVKNIYQLPTQLETLELDLRDKVSML
ncbi:F-box/FBD/LRR-repeat protein At5g53840-like [Fagus crenata]